MFRGAVSGSLCRMQTARSNVVLLEMCSRSFLLSLLAWQLRRAGERGINHIAIVCTRSDKVHGSFELPNSNSEFPTRERSGQVVVAQTHVLWGTTSPWQMLQLSWTVILVLHSKGLCRLKTAYVAMTLYLVFSFYQFSEIPRHSYSEG